MKRYLATLLTVLLVFAALVSVVSATTNHTITIDGTNDFATDENLGTENGRTGYLTWDTTNLYIGIVGNPMVNVTSNVYVVVDSTAVSNADPRSGVGRSDQPTGESGGATYPFNADVVFLFYGTPSDDSSAQDPAPGLKYSVSGGTWSSASIASGVKIIRKSSSITEMEIPFSELGISSDAEFNILFYVANSASNGSNFAQWPTGNADGTNPTLKDFYTYTRSSGIAPNAGKHYSYREDTTAGYSIGGATFGSIFFVPASATTYNEGLLDTLGYHLFIGSNATFSMSSGGSLNIAGNWTKNGGFTHNNNTITFNGSSAQTIGGTSATAFNGLTINNSAGVGLGNSQSVSGVLTLTNGRLSLGNHTLTLGGSATVSGSPDANKMVVTDVNGSQTGKLCKAGLTTSGFTYPIGDARGTAEYSPITFTPTSPSGLTVCFRAVDEAHPNKPATPTTDYLTRYWKGEKTAGSFTNYDISATFINSGSDVEGSTSNMLPKKWDGGFPWAEGGTMGAPTFTWSGLTSLGDFTAFKSGVLAVTLAEFSAQQVSDHVRVTWETASELGNMGFNLYRGTSPAGPDRRLNDLLIPSQSLGNPGGFTYTWDDHADLVPGTTYYYWVEDVDINGAATRHGPVSVDFVAPTAVTVGRVQASPVAPAALPLVGTLLALLTPLAAAGLRRRA